MPALGINSDNTRSLLASLRGMVPDRNLSFLESLWIAEWQATRMREQMAPELGAIPEDVIATLPRIKVVRRPLPTSGLTYWDGEQWVIALNRREPESRQRFSLFHEYKHIVDHGRTERLYRGSRARTPEQQAEQAADYFAGCVLMPKKLIKRAWASGVQTPERIAWLFEVSPRAAEVRLAQLGLTDDRQRCLPMARQRRPQEFPASRPEAS